MLPTNDLKVLEKCAVNLTFILGSLLILVTPLTSTCTAIRDITMKLLDDAPVENIFHDDEIQQEIRSAETGLMSTFTIFAVGIKVPTPGFTIID